jgi:hypothetical protein
VYLTFRPVVGPAAYRTVSTNGSGAWSYPFRPAYTTTLAAYYPGSSTNLASSAPTRAVTVATRITVTGPRNGAASSAATAIAITGSLAPNKAGRTINLVRFVNGRGTVVTRTRVARNGSFRFVVKPARGTYVFAVTIGATTGNAAGSSARFTVRRT